jgi:4-hydroxyphenylpyruvate dioxygenase
MDSNNALKLPSPKPSFPLRWISSKKIGPIGIEIIPPKGNEGFGEGNFQALSESIEREQMRRGVL